ncbi:MAG: DUF3137 domain-containing protein [Bacteroidota bacterium]
MQEPHKFAIFYNRTIQPELQRLDKHRKRVLRKIFWSALVMVGVLSLLAYLDIFVLGLLMTIPVFLYVAGLFNDFRKFVQEFKPNVVRLILDFMDDGLLFGELKYEAKKAIPKVQFLESKIFGVVPEVYEGEDFIEGRIGDIEFDLCELNVQEISRVRERLDPVFRGIFIRAIFKHPPKGIILVLPRTSLPQLSNSLKAFVALGNQKMDGYISNLEFTKAYTVYGSKNTKLSALLPEELMEYILKYRKAKGEIFMSCVGRTIYVAIKNEKDILEPSWFRSNVSFDLVKEFYEDISAALALIQAIDKSH